MPGNDFGTGGAGNSGSSTLGGTTMGLGGTIRAVDGSGSGEGSCGRSFFLISTSLSSLSFAGSTFVTTVPFIFTTVELTFSSFFFFSSSFSFLTSSGFRCLRGIGSSLFCPRFKSSGSS